ncbi:MAG: TetR/AcrR family transcriptional regulator [Sedimentitalea sp.]
MSSSNPPTRDRILKATQNLLESGGAGSVRMSDIAKRAGISRQALYLHFPNRADLLIATTRYLDEVHEIGAEVDAQVMAVQGQARLDGFLVAWGNHIPRIYGVGKALMAIKDTDAEAKAAWDDRMIAVRGLCEASVHSLSAQGQLTSDLTQKQAVDVLWMLVSVRNWEHLTQVCGWSQADYLAYLRRAASRLIGV